MGKSDLAPGQSTLAHLRLQDDVLLLPGDRFIVRQFSPVITIGGGVVLDAWRGGRSARYRARRVSRNDGTRERDEMLAAMTERALAALRFEEIVARTGWLEDEIREVAQKLPASGRARTFRQNR